MFGWFQIAQVIQEIKHYQQNKYTIEHDKKVSFVVCSYHEYHVFILSDKTFVRMTAKRAESVVPSGISVFFNLVGYPLERVFLAPKCSCTILLSER